MGRENNSFTGFFPSSQKNIYFMEWRKSAHGFLYLALIPRLGKRHHVFKFAVKSCAALVRLAHLHVNICDDHFSSSDSLYRGYVGIKVSYKSVSQTWSTVEKQWCRFEAPSMGLLNNSESSRIIEVKGQKLKGRGVRMQPNWAEGLWMKETENKQAWPCHSHIYARRNEQTHRFWWRQTGREWWK